MFAAILRDARQVDALLKDDGERVARSPGSSSQFRSYPCEHTAKHFWRQYAGIGVVTRAMVAVVEFYSARLVHCAVRKRCCRAAQAEYLQYRFMRHAAERHDRAALSSPLSPPPRVSPAGGVLHAPPFFVGGPPAPRGAAATG